MAVQQQLLDIAPSRRIIVPVGSASWWGVDLAVRRIDIGTIHDDGALERRDLAIPLPELDGAARLSVAREDVQNAVAAALKQEQLPRPGYVLVELPAGKKPNMPLAYLSGAVQAGIYDGCRLVGAPPPKVETISSSRWKLIACGRGNIYKPDPKKGRHGEYGVLEWARTVGYTGDDWNTVDAWGLAEAARRTVALEAR